MKKKYVKLNDNYSHLSLGNIISVIKNESKNKTSAIQSEVFCALFNIDYINESTVNNYCVGSRSIGNDYKQTYINLKKKYSKDNTIFINIVCNIITIITGSIYDFKNVQTINQNEYLKTICYKLYNISKNDFGITANITSNFRHLLQSKNYYDLFIQMLLYAILEKKQPLFEEEITKNVIETILQNTDISVNDLQDFLLLELNEGINFSHSLLNLAKDNNPYANYQLAIMEYRGEFGGTPRYDKAYEYFSKAAQNNHPSAYWMLGNMLINNKVGNKDYRLAIEYFEKAKNLGNVAAVNSLGLCYKFGLGVKKDINKAIELFKEAASKNYAYAFNNLGLYYESQKDVKTAFAYFLKSANLNESFACNKVGEYYRIKNNNKEAFFYYQKALNSSTREVSLWAYYNLGKYFYLTGDISTNTLKNTKKAISCFEKSSKLMPSLQELLLIYYQRYREKANKKDLEKIYYYKDCIENHIDYNNKIKALIEKKLKNLKEKKKLDIVM